MATWITDHTTNVCSVEHFGSEEEARNALASLSDCHFCINCKNCIGCECCTDCNDCYESVSCWDCSNVSNMYWVSGLKWLSHERVG